MKLARLLPVLLLPFVFASCTDTREELDIKKDGSGTLAIRTDLGKIIEMMKGFGGEEGFTKEGLDKPFDTTMLLKDYVDTAKSVPAEKKALLRNGKVHLVLNAKDNIGKLDMHFPFASTDQLQQLYESLNSAGGGMQGLFGDLGKDRTMGTDEPDTEKTPGGDKGMPQISSVYDITVKDGVYNRKVNKERYDAFSKAMKIDDLKQMSGMLGEMNYTVAVKFPRAVKKISNPKAALSDDKMTATLSVDLMEIFEHPELLALEIEY